MAFVDSISAEELWDLPTPIIVGSKRKVAERLVVLVSLFDIYVSC